MLGCSGTSSSSSSSDDDEEETEDVIPELLLIPDYNNNRFVYVDDMSGAGWNAIDYSTVGLSAMLDFRPYDVEADSSGRIYIANNYGNTGGARNTVFRMDDMAGTNLIDFGTLAANNGIEALAVDRTRDLVFYYYNDGSPNLYKANLDGTGAVALSNLTGTVGNVYGMDIDSASNVLFLAGRNGAGAPRVFRYDVSTETVTHQYSTNLVDPRDVVVKGDSVFVANRSGANGFKILKLDKATITTLEGSYGDGASSENRSQGNFYNPWRFLAIRKETGLYIVDDTDSPDNYEKLIFMADISGTNWDTFKAQDVGESKFDFYIEC